MNLGRHTVSATSATHILDARFDADCEIFTIATPAGFAVYRTCPLKLLRKRPVTGGTLSRVVPLHVSSLLFLVGGGRSPRYPPNKVVLWDDALGREVAELEFRERVRGLACRRGWLAVALRRRVVAFELKEQIVRVGEWDTTDNPRGLVAIATAAYATLLAMPGRQLGHVQLVHLPHCVPATPLGPPPSVLPTKAPAPPARHPVSIIAAHTSAVSTLAVPPSGRLLATASERGTLVRVWDTQTGKLLREFRRGSDKAEIYGVAFRPDERELCVWSDKGTVHIFAIASGSGAANAKSTFSPLTPFLPLPKYFDSEWSYAQYRIPTQTSNISLSSTSSRTPGRNPDVADEERCVVGWIETPSSSATPEYELVALTYTGGWYRLGLPSASRSSSAPSSPKAAGRAPLGADPRLSRASSVHTARTDATRKGKGKGKERDRERESKRECTLVEYRRFGRWDGW